jgi:hypothetical protein
MKTKVLLALAMGLVVGLTLYPLEGNAMMGGGGGGMGGGSYGMGPGAGQNMGPGSGQGTGPGMNFPGDIRQYSPQTQQPQKPLDKNDARRMAENYLKSTRNPNLHLGKIEDKGNAFEASLLTKNNSLADKILIDKDTGSMRSAY